MHRVFVAVAVSAPLLAGVSSREPDACSLLTPSEVSAAIEATSLPGKPLMPSDHRHCIWSDSPTNSVSSRRVTLTILMPNAFDFGKGVAGNGVKIESVTGIGDDAYYEGNGTSGSPSLDVRKGTTAFQIRILNGMKFKPFTLDQEKAKEADLAKAVVAKL